jgi:hypothetical protein
MISPALLIAALLPAGDIWPEFNSFGGVSQGGKAPTTWSENSNIRWKTPIPGEGVSSPIVCQGRVYVTDCRSTNGTRVLTQPPVRLEPGERHEIAPGTTFELGDVRCTVTLVD